MSKHTKYLRSFGLTNVFVLLLSPAASAQYGSDYTNMPTMVKDMVIITNSDGSYGGASNVDYEFRHPTDAQGGGNWHVYRQNNNDDTFSGNDTWQEVTDNYQNQGNGKPVAGGPWYPQSVQFDNHGGVGHNHAGNLLAANFGNAYTGFELYTINTNGSGDRWSSVFSSHCESGGTYGTASPNPSLSQRMGGVSVSPFNDKVAAISYDDGSLWVLDYYGGGAAAGTGTAQWGQTPALNQGVWAGNPRRSAPIAGGQVGKSGTTNATCWLNENVVAAFNGYGEIVTQDVRAFNGGSNQGDPARSGLGDRTNQADPVHMAPTAMNTWTSAKTGIGNGSASQYCGLVYEPTIDPNHVYSSDTKSSGYTGFLYRVDYNPVTGAFGGASTWQLPSVGGKVCEPRELALDSQGNLLISGYHSGSTGNHCIMVTDLKNNWGNDGALSALLAGSYYGAYCGIDVAADTDILFDITGDGQVDGADFNLLAGSYGASRHQDPTTGYVVDLNNDGMVDGADFNMLAADYGQSYVSGMGAGMTLSAHAIPEPSTMLLLAMGAACACARAFLRRMHRA